MHSFDYSGTWFLFVCSSRTLGLVMDWICVGYIVAIAIILMIFHEGIDACNSSHTLIFQILKHLYSY